MHKLDHLIWQRITVRKFLKVVASHFGLLIGHHLFQTPHVHLLDFGWLLNRGKENKTLIGMSKKVVEATL